MKEMTAWNGDIFSQADLYDPKGVAALARRQGGGWDTSQRPTLQGRDGGGRTKSVRSTQTS